MLPLDVRTDPPRVELGRKLFFDRRLSFNGTMSCAMCHVPEQGFTSHDSKTGVGIEGKSLRRNAPGLLNVAWQASLFHDGRESSLVTQAWMPLLHPDEMANPSIGQVLTRQRELPDYRDLFERAFGATGPSMQTVGEALAAFEATLVAADSRFDRWRHGGEASALSALEQRGFSLNLDCLGNLSYFQGDSHAQGLVNLQNDFGSYTLLEPFQLSRYRVDRRGK